MPMPRVVVKDAESHDTYQPEIDLEYRNGTPAQVIPFPDTGQPRKPKPPTEWLTSRETWFSFGRAIKNGVKFTADLCFDSVDYVAERLSSPTWRAMGRTIKKFTKLGFCMFLDFLDFTIGRLLGFGILFDLGCALMAAALWGKRGWWCLLEVLDITEQIDGFVPSCTLVALRSWNDE